MKGNEQTPTDEPVTKPCTHAPNQTQSRLQWSLSLSDNSIRRSWTL
jgi:hypothetical protein